VFDYPESGARCPDEAEEAKADTEQGRTTTGKRKAEPQGVLAELP